MGCCFWELLYRVHKIHSNIPVATQSLILKWRFPAKYFLLIIFNALVSSSLIFQEKRSRAVLDYMIKGSYLYMYVKKQEMEESPTTSSVSGVPAPAPPRAATRQPSVHGQGKTYQIINKRDIYRKILTTRRVFNLMKTLFKCFEKAQWLKNKM